MELSDSVSLSNAGGRLRIRCTACWLWEEGQDQNLMCESISSAEICACQ